MILMPTSGQAPLGQGLSALVRSLTGGLTPFRYNECTYRFKVIPVV